MEEILSVENMRKSDAMTIKKGISGRELMRRAGEEIFRGILWREPVIIVCGTGNNAGDGYVLARLLNEAGVSCSLILLSEKFSPDGLFYFQRCLESGIPVRQWSGPEALKDAGTIVDCILGTGFRGEIQGTARQAIEAINESDAFIVSVDINSGLSGDSGMAELCVHSDLTVSVGSFQPGHFLGMAKDVMKEKKNCPIGISPVDQPFFLIRENDLRLLFPPRSNLSNKGSYGYTSLIGGSEKYSGAIRLAAMAAAAMRSGAGVVKVAFPRSLYDVIVPVLLEATAFPLRDQDRNIVFDPEALEELTSNTRSAAFGMGIGTGSEVEKSLLWLLKNYSGRLLIDADGLTLLSRLPEHRVLLRSAVPEVLLTPHLKEFSRLTGLSVTEIQNNPIPPVKAYAAETGTILLLKGPTTIVSDGEQVLLIDAGCPGMATAGSGDVLSGILAALNGWMDSSLMAAAAAAWINGKAGEFAQAETNPVSMIASDTIRNIPKVISLLT